MMSEEQAQKFHTDDVSLPRLGSASDWLKRQCVISQKHYPDPGSDVSLV